jgi:hypothetical protein
MPQLLCIFILGASLVMLSAGGADPQDAAAPRPVAAPGSPAAAARPFGEAAVAEDAPAVHSGFPSAKQHTRAVGNALVHGYLGRDPDFAQLTGLGTGRGKRGWATWRRGDWPDIGLRFKATAPKGPHWPVYHLDTKWQAQALWAIRPPSALESRQDAGFGSLYCLTYALPEQAAIVREYAFVPAAPTRTGTTTWNWARRRRRRTGRTPATGTGARPCHCKSPAGTASRAATRLPARRWRSPAGAPTRRPTAA